MAPLCAVIYHLLARDIAAQVLVEEFKNRLISANLVGLLGEAVALVVKDYVLDRLAALLC